MTSAEEKKVARAYRKLNRYSNMVINALTTRTTEELYDLLARCVAERAMLIISGNIEASKALQKLQDAIYAEIDKRRQEVRA